MSTFLAVAAGWLLVLAVLVDVFRTVLWSGQGAGPLTGAVTSLGRRVLKHLPGGGRVRSAVGPVAIVTVISLWASLLVAGFTLVLEGDPDAIRTSATEQPVDWFARAYYVGYSLFTLGNGGIAPVTDGGRLLTIAISATGLFLITLSVTYLLPVISASVASRSFASSALALGETPEDTVLGAWDGERIRLDHELRDLAGQLSILAEQQLAYPVLHLFLSSDHSASAPLAVAHLDDVLTLLDGVDRRVAPPAPPRRQLRAAIQSYVQTYGARIEEEAPTPPLPDTGRLAVGGIPLLQPSAYALAVADVDGHRSGVRGLLHSVGIEER